MSTEKQTELLNFIKSCKATPSFREMAAGIGIKSTNSIDRLLRALEGQGHIRRPRGYGAVRDVQVIEPLKWVTVSDLAPCAAGEKLDVIFAVPDWPKPLSGLASRRSDGNLEWFVNDQLGGAPVRWVGRRPTHYIIAPPLPEPA